MRVVAAPDKFRGTLSAPAAAAAIAAGARTAGASVAEAPIADGGEGTLDALGGPNRSTLVTGPLGDPVEAPWRLRNGVAVVEMALASGLALAGGAEGNDPLAASTAGTGELIAEAVAAGARRVIVAVGGSATTDGGLGALRAMEPLVRLRGVTIEVACDVRIPFTDAARVFGPQKGASDAQVELLTRRLEALVDVYRRDHGVDVSTLAGAGAAGGLAGGLAAVGASLVEGFDLVADEIGLVDTLEDADVVVTGEGQVDDQSFAGKAVGGVVDLATDAGADVLVVAGRVAGDIDPGAADIVSLVERFGEQRALDDTAACVEATVGDWLAERR